MSGESHRAEKVGERVRIELTDMLARGEIHDPAVSGCIVSAVQVTRDLSLARVYVRLLSAEPKEAERKRLVAEYNDKFASPWVAAELGYLDDVIDPLDTRPKLIAALEMLRNKRQEQPRKKHGNLPL